ncbi:MAG: TonB-dependent receptor [Niastella sp.]|uniref:TonB-dependent receptor n=1 Tax=Niastella sp. TaxID=1869183 RepID=UPI00389A57C8
MHLEKLSLVFLLFIYMEVSAQEKGIIKGKIIEQSTKQPVAGATVAIKDNPFSVSADSSGVFILTNIPVGVYTLVITNIGFQQKVLNDINVVKDKTYYLEAELLQDARQLGAVSVRAFKGENNPSIPVSAYSFSREEIFKNPGAQGDIFRAIGILPGVVSSGGQYSAIAVRGQGTTDNVYMADDIPVFQVSHLEVEGFNSGFNDPNGGRFSIFAPRVIDNAVFQGGGFGAQYGRKNSSYLGLGIKEGNRTNAFYSGQFDLIGFTLIYDGPSGFDKKTSVFASARYQDFRYLEKMIGLTSAGLPSYGDYLIKTSTEINAKNKLTFIAMFNPEEYTRTAADVLKSDNLNDDNNSSFVGKSKVNKAVMGLNLRTLTGRNSYWKNILYYRMLDVNNNLGNSTPQIDNSGNIIKSGGIPYETDLRHIKNKQFETGYRSIFSTKINRGFTATGGIDVARVDIDYARNLKHTDTLYTLNAKDYRPNPSVYYLILDPSDFNAAVKNFAYNVSGYVDLSLTLFNHLTLNPGVRYDYTGFTTQHTIAPRISGSVGIDEKQSINFSAGVYYQDPSFSDIASQPAGHRLKNERAYQYILGYRIYFTPDLKFTAEGWYKKLDNLAVQPASGRPFLTSEGTGNAHGFDVSIIKRLSQKYHGQLSYSYMKSKRDDHDGLGEYDYIFNLPHVISVLGSYEYNKKWIFSGKFRYATGRPTDKYIVHANVFNDQAHLRYSQEIVSKNGERLADFISLDLRADYKFQLKKIGWTAFFDVVNVMNRFNESSAIFQPLTGQTYFLGLAVFPTFGIRMDF